MDRVVRREQCAGVSNVVMPMEQPFGLNAVDESANTALVLVGSHQRPGRPW